MAKPERYPLPWCEEFDKPYYKLNLFLCLTDPEWRKKQSGVPMSTIIPWLDELIASKDPRLERLRSKEAEK